MSNWSKSQLIPSMAFALACGGNPPAAELSPVATPGAVASVESEPAATPGSFSDARVMELGRAFTGLLHAREFSRLWSQLAPDAKRRLGSIVEFEAWVEENLDGLGTEERVIRESVVMPREGMLADKVYVRIARYAGAGDRPVRLLVGLKNDGSVVGMQIRQAQ